MESVQLLNTAIIKSKEKKIDNSYDERLKKICQSPVFDALNKAISHLAETQRISRDQASLQIIETIRELDSVWTDYVTMEGIHSLRNFLKTQN
jgi:hypothetical protein